VAVVSVPTVRCSVVTLSYCGLSWIEGTVRASTTVRRVCDQQHRHSDRDDYERKGTAPRSATATTPLLVVATSGTATAQHHTSSSPASADKARAKFSLALVTGAKRRLLARPPVSFCSPCSRGRSPHRPPPPSSRARRGCTSGERQALACLREGTERRRRIFGESARCTRLPATDDSRNPDRKRSADDRNRAGPERSEWSARRSVAQQSGRRGEYCDCRVPNRQTPRRVNRSRLRGSRSARSRRPP
jgi:hypothetical protein